MLPDTRHLTAVFTDSLGVDLRLGSVHHDAHEDTNTPRLGRARAPLRRRGRALLRALCAEVEDDADVETLEFPHPRYSLTYSGDMSLAVADASASLGGIGVDLELDRSVRPQAARFFLTDEEQRWLQTLDCDRRSQALLRLWCIKEAVFKANPANHGTLLGDHVIVRPAATCGEARTREGRVVEYTSWCESRSCVAVAVCR